MDDSSKQICRLCLEVAPTCECKLIEEIKEDIVEVLLINIDFEICDYAVACSNCLGKLHNCFEFKSHCDNILTNIDPKLDIKKEALQSKLINQESTYKKNPQVCRLCMSLIGDETFDHTAVWKDGVLLKDMIRSYFPEMDLKTVHEPVVCKPCLGGMKKYCEFMESCREVEQRIEHFRTGYGTTGRVSLEDVLKFKDCNVLGKPVIIKKECSDVDVVDEGVMNCLKNEESESIKFEEIYIKDELDHGMETTDSDQSEDDSCGKDDISKTEGNVGEVAKRAKKYFCPKCPHSSWKSRSIKNHMRTHSDNESHQCFLCLFITDTRFSLKTHMMSHRGATKTYGCPECPYETDRKQRLALHILKHKDESEVEMQKCPLCSYTTKYRTAVMRHVRLQHDKNSRKIYKCKECLYSTKDKNNFLSHQLVHSNPKDVPMHKCTKCEFETKYKRNLARHIVIHEDLEMVNKIKYDKCTDKLSFSCDQCTYSSKCMGHLVSHKCLHQRDGEMYKCKLCGYQAKNKVTLKVHMVKSHMDTSVSIMKCAHCPYETVVKSYLSKHMRKWHSCADRVNMGLGETVVHPVKYKLKCMLERKSSLKMKRRKVNKN